MSARAVLSVIVAAAIGAAAALPATARDAAIDVYAAMGVKVADVLNGSVLQAKVLPGPDKQVVAAVTYLTGKREESQAINVRLEVYRRDGDKLVSMWARDYGAESGGAVGRGELQVIDIDADGLAEIIMTWDALASKVVDERRCEVILREGDAFRIAWSGAMAYDATRAAREVPEERRDRYVRELDIPATMKTKGITLFTTKTMLAVAGQRLATPKKIQETFPLKPE